MKDEMIRTLEEFLNGNDFGKNWDGAYQDAVPTLRRFFQNQGFETVIKNGWESESGEIELVATKDTLMIRIPWAESYQGRSLVHLESVQVQTRPLHQAAASAK